MPSLTEDDLRHFARDGYLILRDVVPEDAMAAADAEVDHLIDAVPPTHDGAGQDATFWFLPPAELPGCAALFRATPARALAESLVAPLPIDIGLDHVQVAITVPPWPHHPGAPHIDGFGHDPEQVASFTMLAGVPLTDQRSTSCGNLWVWPGSHLVHQDLFRERGPLALQPTFGHSTLLPDPPVLGPPVELQLGRGDLLLSHYLLGHNKGGNTTDTVRRTIYFRLRTEDHETRWRDTLLDAWTEYAPVRAALDAGKG